MMNPPRAIENADHEVSRVWEDQATWEPHLSFGQQKSDNKDGTAGLISVFENACNREIAGASPVAVCTAKCSHSKEVGFENPLGEPISQDRNFVGLKKAVENKVVEACASDFEFNKGPRIDGGSDIWERGKLLGATTVSDDVEIMAQIQVMKDRDKLIWQQTTSESVVKAK
ncbi:hypothetical protein Ancab_032782, partial [Ancistrocladus abbreviatus]